MLLSRSFVVVDDIATGSAVAAATTVIVVGWRGDAVVRCNGGHHRLPRIHDLQRVKHVLQGLLLGRVRFQREQNFGQGKARSARSCRHRQRRWRHCWRPPPPQRQTAAVVGGGGDKVGAERILGRGKQNGFVRIGQLTLLRGPADGMRAAARHTAHLKQLKTMNPPRKNFFAFHL